MPHIAIMIVLAIVTLAGCASPRQKPQHVTTELSTSVQNLRETSNRSPLPAPSRQTPFSSPAPAPAPTPAPTPAPAPVSIPTSLPSRSAIVHSAVRLLGSKTITIQGRRITYDCAGMTRAIFLEHGIDLYRSSHLDVNANGVRLIHNHVRQHGMLHQDLDVRPGDLVFFDNTWDFNGDGLLNDPLTHVGIVEQIEPDETVIFISRVAGAVARYRMNLSQPHVHKTAEGRLLNDYIRRKRATDPENTVRLTGELFSFYGNLLSPQKNGLFQGQSEQHPYRQRVSDTSSSAVAEQ